MSSKVNQEKLDEDFEILNSDDYIPRITDAPKAQYLILNEDLLEGDHDPDFSMSLEKLNQFLKYMEEMTKMEKRS